jgi:thymidine kinase
MFIEPSWAGERRGWIEVICGSMFSGKTEELIRRLKRVEIAHLKMKVFKPAVDKRFHEMQIISHDENSITSIPLDNAKAILTHYEDADVVGIDEAQFFDDELPAVCEHLAKDGVRVIVAGLDMDFKGNPFGPVPHLLAKAEYITKLHAICVRCGNIASFSYRKTNEKDQVLLGAKDLYEPRCRKCFFEENAGYSF